jgi:glycosyltransferase involved in cell wall biosynthesis
VPELSRGNVPLTIAVPVYEEADNIEKLVRTVEALVRLPHELAIVYDLDEDTTLPVVRALAPEFPNIRLMKNQFGNGRGVVNAVRTGLYGTDSDHVCVMTADSTDPPDAVARMYSLAGQGYDLVSASRYSKGGRKYGGPWFQTLLSKWGNAIFQGLTGFPISDPTYSLKMYSRGLLNSVKLEDEGGWALSFELSVKAHLQGFRMTEIGTVWVDRQLGVSKFRLTGWFPVYAKWFFYGLWAINRRRWSGGISSVKET